MSDAMHAEVKVCGARPPFCSPRRPTSTTSCYAQYAVSRTRHLLVTLAFGTGYKYLYLLTNPVEYSSTRWDWDTRQSIATPLDPFRR